MQTKPNINEAQNIKPIDTIVHFGAGRCSELDDYLTLQPRQLLLIEADPQLAECLKNRTKEIESVQVACVAVAGQAGPATFHRFTLPKVNSLHRATGLLELFPGLKTVELLPVKTFSPAALLEPMQLQAEQENRLVIDLPGKELPLLLALQQSQQLDLFSQVYLYCGREQLYEGSEPATQILEWLGERGFDQIAEDDCRDPDRPCWRLRRNTLQLQNRNSQRQLEQLTEENNGLTQHVADLKAQAKLLTQDRDAQSKHAGKLDVRIDVLTKLANEHQVQLAQAYQARAEQEELVTGLNQQIEELSKIEVGLKQELIDTRQSVSLSIRLQALREADLKDLQSRYQESLVIQESQHQLLVKLGERLSAASNYFHQLANSQAAPLSDKKLIQKTQKLKKKAKKKKAKQNRSQSAHKLSKKEEGEN